MSSDSVVCAPVEGPRCAVEPRTRAGFGLLLGLIGLFAAFAALPRVHDSPALLAIYLGTAGVLLAGALAVAAAAARAGRALRVELVRPLKSHYIQGTVQLCVYAWWGWTWREIYASFPLILSQMVFFVAFEALLAWSRGRTWRLGCGVLPVILSTNVFIWFKDDVYWLQFALVATAALGKEFIRWQRDGKSTHVFNPSAFAMSLFAIGLLVTGTTHDLTWAGRLATTIGNPPHMYLLIFALGLVVQHFFSITLMTFSAVLVLCALNLLHTATTGTYFFIFSNLPVPVFLGLHLLVTDPSTSPRTNAGKALFGALYGGLAFAFYALLERYSDTTVYDKLLPVPLLNLGVQAIDRVARAGWLGRFTSWESAFRARTLNYVHMGCWGGVFALMVATGYVGRQHEGGTYEFWRQALDEGRDGAAQGLTEVLEAMAREGSASAWNELGLLHLEGKHVEANRKTAIRYFAQAAKRGNAAGAANLVQQYLLTPSSSPPEVVMQALDLLEREVAAGGDGSYAYVVGMAWETGNGRPQNKRSALELYRIGCERGAQTACRALARLTSQSGAAGPPAGR